MRQTIRCPKNPGKNAILWTLAFALVMVHFAPSCAQQPSRPPNWDGWEFLLGDWIGEGGGGPGQGTGGFTFTLDLQKQILVRKNHADFPASAERPAFSHDDLMIIYQDPPRPARAVYFDNESHVIHYTAEFSKDRNTLTFVSDPIPSSPRFRMIYSKTSDKILSIKFEIAPPGSVDTFSTYIQSTARRQ